MASGIPRHSTRLAAAGYLAVALFLFWPLPLRLATHMAGDPFGDPLLNAWILGWDADRLVHGLRGLWDAPIFYPFRDTLAWSEHLLGVALFVAPAYWLTGNILLPYNLALLGSVVLAGMGMYLLAFEITGRRSAAWLAGLAFACLPYRIGQLGHLQVLMAGWMPLALLGLHRYFRGGSRRALAGFAAAFLLTALSNGYYLFFLSIPAGIVCLWHLAERRQRGALTGRLAAELCVALLAIALALAPVVAAYLRVKDTQGFTRTRREMVRYSAAAGDYATVSPRATLWGPLMAIGKAERQLFPGLGLTLLAAAGLVVARRQRVVAVYAAIGVAALVLSHGPEPDLGVARFSRGPYDWLLALPGWSGLRVPARLAMIVYLAMSVLAAAGAARITRALRGPAVPAFVAALSAIVLAEGRPSVPLVAATRALSLSDGAYRWLARQPPGAMLEFPAGGAPETVRYLAGTLVHRHPIVNGYSGYRSALQGLFAGPPGLEPSHAEDLLDAAAAIGVRYVLVHEHLYEDRAYASRLAGALRSAPPSIVRSARTIDFTTIVELAPRSERPAPPVEPPLVLTGCAATASHASDTASRAVDGSRDTRWSSGLPQAGGEWLVVTCHETRILTGLDVLVSHRSLANYPRRLAVDRSADGVTFETVFEGSVLAALATSLATDGREPSARLVLQPGAFNAIRLRQVGRAERPSFWAVDELVLRGR